ncbi:MAG: TIGR04150 pseudo-rSAM protein [bacterium]|nr:TIGR04150 pseudo-rSAM protein [bacterium]
MKHYWLYLEPYVYVNTVGGETIFYNTLNGAVLESKHPEIVSLARRLCHRKNLYVVKLSDARLTREPYAQFIASLREQFMGDLMDTCMVEDRPTQFMPIMKNLRDIHYLRNADMRSVGENILTYLHHVTLHITDSCTLNCPQCRRAHRQCLYCYRGEGGRKKELSIDGVRNFIAQMGSQRPRLYITGGDVTGYSRLKELCLLLQMDFSDSTFFLHLDQAGANLPGVERILSYGFTVQIGVPAPFDAAKATAVNQLVAEKNGDCTWMLLVQNGADIDGAEKMVEQAALDNCFIQPFFDGENHSFFRESIFSEKEDVCLQCLSHKEILARQTTAPHHFGSFTILPDGGVYANLQSPRLGSIEKHSLHEMLLKELKGGKNWLRARKRVKPCRSCVWNALCPPLSNYEYALGHNDLCWKHRIN